MQEKDKRRSNVARSEEMRARLIAAARALFVEKGFADTSTPEIVKSAGVTRGAMYHHFADKVDLFRAVLIAEHQAVADEIDSRALEAGDAIQALMAGAAGYLDAMDMPGRVRLMLLDAPAVLSRAEIDQIDHETSAGTLRTGLEAAIAAGDIKPLPIQPLTEQLSALFDRAAMAVAGGEDAQDHLDVIKAILNGLRP